MPLDLLLELWRETLRGRRTCRTYFRYGRLKVPQSRDADREQQGTGTHKHGLGRGGSRSPGRSSPSQFKENLQASRSV